MSTARGVVPSGPNSRSTKPLPMAADRTSAACSPVSTRKNPGRLDPPPPGIAATVRRKKRGSSIARARSICWSAVSARRSMSSGLRGDLLFDRSANAYERPAASPGFGGAVARRRGAQLFEAFGDTEPQFRRRFLGKGDRRQPFEVAESRCLPDSTRARRAGSSSPSPRRPRHNDVPIEKTVVAAIRACVVRRASSLRGSLVHPARVRSFRVLFFLLRSAKSTAVTPPDPSRSTHRRVLVPAGQFDKGNSRIAIVSCLSGKTPASDQVGEHTHRFDEALRTPGFPCVRTRRRRSLVPSHRYPGGRNVVRRRVSRSWAFACRRASSTAGPGVCRP